MVSSLRVKALGVPLNTNLERGVDEYFEELVPPYEASDHAALRPKRRHKSTQHNEPGIDHQSSHFAGTANVLNPIEISEAKVAVEPATQVVAVERIGVH